MKRGDVVIVAPFPPFDKPRPAVILQAQLLDLGETVSVALITSDRLWLPGCACLWSPALRTVSENRPTS